MASFSHEPIGKRVSPDQTVQLSGHQYDDFHAVL